ncbi:hypothetical protein [Cypionkella sp.]|uniref:hypothetical protein n=1 Tax=Cypionkella sp. TaxID=2811411 RepID=UPI00262DEF75|nr:hypothetical protein [Cypionkella sp.]MDB5663593.1 hypothetical protein [Cypionkella sp.]
MTKHIADRREPSNGARLQHFLRLAREASPAAPRQLHQRPQTRSEDNRRMQEYLRIERGIEA